MYLEIKQLLTQLIFLVDLNKKNFRCQKIPKKVKFDVRFQKTFNIEIQRVKNESHLSKSELNNINRHYSELYVLQLLTS